VAESPDPIELATRALRHHDRSRRELDERLERAGIAEDSRAEALDELERLGYLDDTRLARQRASSLADRGYGDEAIRERLAGQGVAAEVVDDAVALLEPESERAAKLVASLGATAGTAGRLRRKGFGEDAVEHALAGGFAAGGPEA